MQEGGEPYYKFPFAYFCGFMPGFYYLILPPDFEEHQPAEHPGRVPGLQAGSAGPTGAGPAGL